MKEKIVYGIALIIVIAISIFIDDKPVQTIKIIHTKGVSHVDYVINCPVCNNPTKENETKTNQNQ